MKLKPTILLIPALLLSALLGGCASLPDEVAVDDPGQLPAFADLQANPDQYKGQPVVLGGMVVSVTNSSDSSTLEVLQLPLYSSGRPKTGSDQTGGRFRAVFSGFLDPEVYANGRMVTVRGQVSGSEEDKIGDHPYTYLILQGDGHYLWREQPDEVQVRYYMGIQSYYPYPVYVRPAAPARPKNP